MKTKHLTGVAMFAVVASLALAAGTQAAPLAAPAQMSSVRAVPFDRAFIDAMVPHHQLAIEMAKAAKRAGLSKAPLVKIANDIVATQGKEIAGMLAWRKAWYGSTKLDPRAGAQLGLSMSQMGMSHAVGDLRHEGNVNAAFASMMIDHHQGAIRMARLALAKAAHSELRALANRIIAAQSREIRIMRPYAGTMGGMHKSK